MQSNIKLLLSITALCLILESCSAKSPYPVSDHFDGEKFFNPGLPRGGKKFSELFKWWTRESAVAWPDRNEAVVGDKPFPKAKEGHLVATFINHATVLLQFGNRTLITDPIFSERASPLSWIGPKRYRAPGFGIEDLPKINAIVISHNHYDHMDIDSLEKLCQRDDPIIFVPLANAEIIEDVGCRQIIELDWWQSHKMDDDFVVTATPAQHWSARGLFDRFDALWAGYFVRIGGQDVFFAGDTGYAKHFSEIKNKLGSPLLAILPIGAYEPRWFMKTNHMNPADAVKAHSDLGALHSIPIHFGTFDLSNEGQDQPVEDLQKALHAERIDPNKFVPLSEGGSLDLVP